jgi:hypothetical protein
VRWMGMDVSKVNNWDFSRADRFNGSTIRNGRFLSEVSAVDSLVGEWDRGIGTEGWPAESENHLNGY